MANGPSRTDTLTDKPLGAGRRPGKNLQGRVHKRILHSALDREEVGGPEDAGNVGKTMVEALWPTHRRAGELKSGRSRTRRIWCS